MTPELLIYGIALYVILIAIGAFWRNWRRVDSILAQMSRSGDLRGRERVIKRKEER